jgi:hypothetical protein
MALPDDCQPWAGSTRPADDDQTKAVLASETGPASETLRTDEIAESERFARWRHWVSGTFVPPECAPVSQLSQNGRQATMLPGDLAIYDCRRPYTMDLLATRFGERAGGQHRDPAVLRRSLLLGVCAWIDANLGEPGLDPDPAHFSKIFKASYGEPPGQYRHRSKAAGEPREAMTQAAR